MRNGQLVDVSFAPLSTVVVSGSLKTFSGSIRTSRTLVGDEFSSVVDAILLTSMDNFQKNQLIATIDPIFEDDSFALGPQNISFVIQNEKPLSDPNSHTTNVNSLESLFSDPRLHKLPNFKFLPPIEKIKNKPLPYVSPFPGPSPAKTSLTNRAVLLANYIPLGPTLTSFTHLDVLAELNHYELMGQMKTVRFEPTSRLNTLFMQMFEVSRDTMKKLDVIDFGLESNVHPQAYSTTYISDPNMTTHVFFIGKVIADDNGTDKFLHMFTLVFG
jgi:hypothetical protein